MSDELRYGIAELAARAGVTRRAVRYYVQRGLLPPPVGLGRGQHYTEAHLGRLLAIKAQQAAGRSLADIAAMADAAALTPAGSLWWRVPLAPGVELHVRRGRDPVPEDALARLAAAARAILGGGPAAPFPADTNDTEEDVL